MPTIIGHALVGVGLLNLVKPATEKSWYNPLLVSVVVLSMLPDADVLGFRFGIKYSDPLGHRGFSHSLVFAAVTGVFASVPLVVLFYKRSTPSIKQILIVYLTLATVTASHPLLDMLTDGGLGSALFAPFSWSRLFFSVTPIPVSPIGLRWSVGPVLAWELLFFLPFFLGSFGLYSASIAKRWIAWGLTIFGTVGSFMFRIGF